MREKMNYENSMNNKKTKSNKKIYNKSWKKIYFIPIFILSVFAIWIWFGHGQTRVESASSGERIAVSLVSSGAAAEQENIANPSGIAEEQPDFQKEQESEVRDGTENRESIQDRESVDDRDGTENGESSENRDSTGNRDGTENRESSEDQDSERKKPAFARAGALSRAKVTSKEEIEARIEKEAREEAIRRAEEAARKQAEAKKKKIALQKKAAAKKKLKESKRPYIMKDVPADNEVKSYERYTLLTSWKQAELQELAHTDGNGMRKVGNRYCVALGSYYTTEIGVEFDLIMENGNVIPCILGDQKSDLHTDAKHQRGANGGCVAEFIVDVDKLPETAKQRGSVHWIPGLEGEIKSIKIYTDKKGI